MTERPPLLRWPAARAPKPMIDAVRGYAVRTGQGFGSALREIVVAGLEAKGGWPPTDNGEKA